MEKNVDGFCVEEVGAGQQLQVIINDIPSYSKTLQKVAVIRVVCAINTSGKDIYGGGWRQHRQAGASAYLDVLVLL